MTLVLQRRPSSQHATVGHLSLEGVPCCFTLEDVVREVPGAPVETWKIPGETAIPAGRYPLDVTFSNRFQRMLPLVCAVPGFTGVRIHPGNTDADTAGCILVGREWAGGDTIQESRLAFEVLYPILRDAVEAGEVWLTVVNPPAVETVA